MLKRIDKDPGNHRIENLICGKSEVVQGSQYMPKVILPGRMPIWLEPCPSHSLALAAIGAALTSRLPQVESLVVTDMGPVLAVHVGSGAVGVIVNTPD